MMQVGVWSLSSTLTLNIQLDIQRVLVNYIVLNDYLDIQPNIQLDSRESKVLND